MIPHELDRWASAMRALRPDWRHDSLRTFAGNHLADKPYRDALIAGVWIATDPDARTPHLLTTDGPWWAACQPAAAPKPVESGIVTHCHHNQPGRTCDECYPKTTVERTPPTAEQKAAIRAAVAAGRAELARIEQINEARPSQRLES